MLENVLYNARMEGRAEAVLDLFEGVGELPQLFKEHIMAETNLENLQSWLRIAAKATSIDLFQENVKFAQRKAEDIIEILEESNDVPENLKRYIMNQTDLELLRHWYDIACEKVTVKGFVGTAGLTGYNMEEGMKTCV